MGEVYAAWDRELDGPVAIKTVNAAFADDPAFLKQVRREIQAARRIQHPNVCRVFDLHRAEGSRGVPLTFLTMELLEGRTLHETLAEATLPEDRAILLASELAAGLEAIHAAGIVHRDLKSGNVMLAGTPPRAVILDFGLARDVSRNLLDSLSVFGSQAIVGTPAYMAPEQLTGQPLTARSDVYALGVILFEALTGRLPFEGETALAIALRKLRGPAPLLRSVAPALGARWERAVASCLEPSPEHRPASAAAVIDILEGRSKGTARIPRRRIVAAVAVAAVLAGAGIVAGNLPHRAPAAAQIRFQKAEEFARRRTAEGLQEAVAEYQGAISIDPRFAAAWSGLADVYAASVSFMYLDPREARSKAAEAAARALELDSRQGKAHSVLASVLSWDFERWKDADAPFRRAVAAYPREPRLHDSYAGYLGRIGQHEAAIREALTALSLDPAGLNPNLRLATEYYRARRWKEFLAQAREVVRMQPLEQDGRLTLARALEWNREFEAAEAELAKARLYGPPALVEPQEATLLAAEGRVTEAEAVADRVRRLWEQAQGKSKVEANQVAGMYGAMGRADDVASVLEAGLRMGDTTVLAAYTNPYLTALRQHPKVAAILKRLGYTAL